MGSCQPLNPLGPRPFSKRANDDGLEWTYDRAWQTMRFVNANLDCTEDEAKAIRGWGLSGHGPGRSLCVAGALSQQL